MVFFYQTKLAYNLSVYQLCNYLSVEYLAQFDNVSVEFFFIKIFIILNDTNEILIMS